jgi:hypothetical protein
MPDEAKDYHPLELGLWRSDRRYWALMTMSRARGLALAVAAAISLIAFMPTAAAGANWTMAHLDIGRSGNDISDPAMNSNVAWTSPTLDGRSYGEPVVLGNTVYVATLQNSLYALDLNDGHVIWSLLNIMPSVPIAAIRAATAQPSFCGNIDPMGIVGTPVIDPSRGAAGTLFAAAETWTPNDGTTIEHRLLAVDLATHAVSSTNIDPATHDTGSTRGLEQERGALALAGGKVVVPFGGLVGDCGNYHGAAVSVNENLTGKNTFLVDPNSVHGGIWAAGGPSADTSGNFYVTTGNGNEQPTEYQYSDSVVKLSPTMGVLSSFAPKEWDADNRSDLDLGSMTPILIPRAGSPLVFATGKQHVGFLLDSANLGGIDGQLYRATVCDLAALGAAAYSAPYVYVPCGEGLRALTINTATPSFSRVWQGPGDATGPPILAAGLVWLRGDNKLYGLNPTTGATVRTLTGITTPYNFGSPSAANGHLLFAMGNRIQAWGTCNPPGGYELDGWGGLHPYCGAPSVTSQDGYWPNWDIARGVVQRPSDNAAGYVLDGYGGVHEFAAGVTPPLHRGNGTHAYWPGWDIARGIALDPCDSTGNSGYTLDGWGGIHPFGGAPAVSGGPYWYGWDIARGLVLNPTCPGNIRSGFVLDGFGGVHGFGGAADPPHNGYWPNWDIARGIVSTGTDGGYTLDGWGGVHNFGSETHAVADAGHAYWPGWDIARGIVSAGTGGGYTLDGWGGIHPFGGTVTPSGGGYWPGWDIANGLSH